MSPLHLKKYLSLIVLVWLSYKGHSQLDNSFLHTANPDSLLIPNASKFGFIIDNVNYIRNTEYRGVIEQGATWAGAQIWPSFIYRTGKNLTFKTGLFLQKDFGNNHFRTPIPTYTLSYTSKQIKVNFGTLDGSLDHNLIEPLYGLENFIDKRIENGIQIKGKFKKFAFDHWVDWEKMIYRNSRTPEIFTVGISSNFNAFKSPNVALDFPIQILGRHHGGEIYIEPHDNIRTQFNFAYGTKLSANLNSNPLTKLEFQGYLTFYEDLSPSKADSFRDGTGQFYSLKLKMKNLSVMFNYLESFQNVALLGEPLYSARSRKYPGNYLQYQKMAMLRLMYESYVWPNCSLVGRLNAMYDFSESKVNTVMELYFKYNIGWNIPLKKPKFAS